MMKIMMIKWPGKHLAQGGKTGNPFSRSGSRGVTDVRRRRSLQHEMHLLAGGLQFKCITFNVIYTYLGGISAESHTGGLVRMLMVGGKRPLMSCFLACLSVCLYVCTSVCLSVCTSVRLTPSGISICRY